MAGQKIQALEMEKLIMAKTSSILITRKLTLTFAAFFVWMALTGGILQYLLGGKLIGGFFILIGIILIIADQST